MFANFWRLEDEKTGEPVSLPAQRMTFRGESWTVTGGNPPHTPNSTGRAEGVQNAVPRINGEFYPSVFGLRWSLRPELHAAAQLMIQRGGGFAGRLAEAYLVADSHNAWRLLDAFDDLFARYLDEVLREPA